MEHIAVATRVQSILQDSGKTPLERIMNMRTYLASIEPGLVENTAPQAKPATDYTALLSRLDRRLAD